MSKNPLDSSRKDDSVTSGQDIPGQDASGTQETKETTSARKPGFAAAAQPHSLLGQAESEEPSITSNPIQT